MSTVRHCRLSIGTFLPQFLVEEIVELSRVYSSELSSGEIHGT